MLREKANNYIIHCGKVDKERETLKINLTKLENERLTFEEKNKREFNPAELSAHLEKVNAAKTKTAEKIKKIGRFKFTDADKNFVKAFKVASGNKRNTLINEYAGKIGVDFTPVEKTAICNALSGKKSTTSFERYNGNWIKDRSDFELLNVLYSVLVDFAINRDLVKATDYSDYLSATIRKKFDARNADIKAKNEAKEARRIAREKKRAEKALKEATEKANDDAKTKNRRTA